MYSKSFKLIYLTVITFISYIILCVPVFAESKVGVIVPELRAPYKIIFESIGDGIDKKLGMKSSRLVISKDYDSSDISRWINSKNIEAVITLGSLGQKASLYIPANTPVVLGALLSFPKSGLKYPGVALTPDPEALFSLLTKMDNSRKKVAVVYNPSKNQWIVDLAKRQAAEKRLQLVAYRATDIKQAAIIYDEIFSSGDLDNTALWLLQDRKIVDTKVVLPFILEKAWRKKIVVFSSALSHVKKGVLFSMYPNNESHGEQLAKILLAKRANSTRYENKLYPTDGLQEAVNSRTAEHLGLNLTRSRLREFDVVFPVSN